MDAIHVLRGSSVAARARWAMTIAAAAAFSAAVVAVVTFGAHAVHASPPTAATLAATGRATVDTSPGRDPSLPSAQAVFDVQTGVLTDELPPSF
jgi:hypothetical protein